MILTHRSRVRVGMLLGLCLHGLSLVVPAWGAAPKGGEPEPMIKAAIVFNLRHFVVWPDSDAVVRVGVLGGGPVADALSRLDGREGPGGAIHIVRITRLEPGQDLDLCYLGDLPRPIADEELRSLSESGVLTVSDSDRFLERGGILQLVVRDRRVHLRIQLDRARRARLQFRAQLLKLAEVVND